MKILVKQAAFIAGSRRRPGEVMDVADDTKGDWFDVLDPGKPAVLKAKSGKADSKQADSKQADDLV